MSDDHTLLVERLRKGANCVGFLDGAPEPAADVADMLRKAADRIEQLEIRAAKLREGTGTVRSFHNALRILTSIDRHELIEGGVIEEDDEVEWAIFRDNPHKWAILADNDQFDALWAVMKMRGA